MIAHLLIVAALAAKEPEPVLVVLLRDGRPAGAYGPMSEHACFAEVVKLRGEATCVTRAELRERLRSMPGWHPADTIRIGGGR